MSIDPKTLPGNSAQARRTSSGLSDCGGANRDPVCPARDCRANRLDCAQSAAHVDSAFHGRANLGDRLDISRCAGNRAIKIDDMD